MCFWTYKVNLLNVSLQLLLGVCCLIKASGEHPYWILIKMNKLQSTSHGESQVRRFSGDIGEDDMRRWSCSPLTYEDAIRHSQADSPISASESCYDEVFRNSTSSGYYSASSENRSRATTSSNMMSETLVQDLQSNDAVFEESGGIIPSPIKFNFDEAELRRRGIRTHRSNDNIRYVELEKPTAKFLEKSSRSILSVVLQAALWLLL